MPECGECSHRTGVVGRGYRDRMISIALRPLRDEDADLVFAMMADPHARNQAAFVHADPHDRAGFDDWWNRIRENPRTRDRAITRVHNGDAGELLGTISAFDIDGDREVSFWLLARHTGHGIASAALALLLDDEHERPLHARAAADNLASRRVLDRAGFALVGRETSYAEGRSAEIEEVVYRLD